MNNKLRIVVFIALSGAAFAPACSSGETVGGPTGTSTGNAGTNGVAGTNGNAGTNGVAGTYGRGGTTGTAGTTGLTGTAGTNGRGGTTGTAGTNGRGGTTGTAGTTGTGTAGTTGSAGTSGTGQCGAAWNVANDGFVTVPAMGGVCWSGYAFAGGDSTSTVTPTSFMTCGIGCMLKATGTVGASVAPAYAGNAYLGFSIAQPSGGGSPGTVAPTGTGIKVSFTNSSATTTLRVQLAADATGTTFWCYTVTGASPVTIPYAMLRTMCWDTTMGTAYAKQPVMSIQLSIPGDATAKALNLTLTGVTEY
jgi:hypothetical protein